MKKLVLDTKRWRCGSGGANRVGEGMTELKNKEGFMCCLGQFACQLADIPDNQLIGAEAPQELQIEIPLLTDGEDNSPFSETAMYINDDVASTPETKIELLTKLCREHGYELEVKNWNS